MGEAAGAVLESIDSELVVLDLEGLDTVVVRVMYAVYRLPVDVASLCVEVTRIVVTWLDLVHIVVMRIDLVLLERVRVVVDVRVVVEVMAIVVMAIVVEVMRVAVVAVGVVADVLRNLVVMVRSIIDTPHLSGMVRPTVPMLSPSMVVVPQPRMQGDVEPRADLDPEDPHP